MDTIVYKPFEPKPGTKKKGPGGKKRKFDLEKAKALYIGGMSKKDILKTPEFVSMSEGYLNKIAFEQHWASLRETSKNASEGAAGKALIASDINNREKQITRHYTFMFAQIERERKVFEKRVLTNNTKDQRERMEILERIHDQSRKALGLDDMKPGDANANSFKFLMAIHSAPTDQSAKAVADKVVEVVMQKIEEEPKLVEQVESIGEQ